MDGKGGGREVSVLGLSACKIKIVSIGEDIVWCGGSGLGWGEDLFCWFLPVSVGGVFAEARFVLWAA